MNENKAIDIAVDFCASTITEAAKSLGMSEEEFDTALNEEDEKVLAFIGKSVVKFYYYYGMKKIHLSQDTEQA